MINNVKLHQEGTLKKVSGTEYFIVVKSYIFQIFNEDGKIISTITVPEGFYTNFGSIPSIFFFFDKTRYVSYILHDYLYSLIGQVVINGTKRCLTKHEGDIILNIGLKNEGMNSIGKFLVYYGLFIGGFIGYKKHDKKISGLKIKQNKLISLTK